MTSGKGILHKEYHEKNFSKKGGEMQMVQLWVNLPAKDKMTEPKYQNIENKDLAKVDLGNGIGSIDIIAGEFEKSKGPASSFTPLSLFNVKLNKGKGTSLSFNENDNTGLLIIKGNVTLTIKSARQQITSCFLKTKAKSLQSRQKMKRKYWFSVVSLLMSR